MSSSELSGLPYRACDAMRLLITSCLLGLLSLGAIGCVSSIGDSCEVTSDCPRGAFCDITAPGGYCTVSDCTPGGCPDEAVCVEFDEASSYCMRHCSSEDDCRDGYTCRNDSASRGFCYVESSTPTE